MSRQTNGTQISSGAAIFWGVLSVGIAVALAFMVDAHAGAPATGSLQSAEGVIEWTAKSRRHVSFRLSGYENTLRFALKGGGVSEVAAALEEAARSGRTGRVLHGAPNRRPIFVGKWVATAYQLEIDGRMVRSWEQTNASYERDNRIFPWICGGLGLGGVYLIVHGVRRRAESAA